MNTKQEQLVLNNVNLVYEITKPYKALKNYEDIVAEGMLGLCKAASSFEEIRGNNFSTFAYMHILGKCLNYIHTDKIVKPKRTNGKYEPVTAVNLSVELENTCVHAVEIYDYNKDENWLLELLKKKLEPHQFTILLLLYNGYKRKEIVNITKTTISQLYNDINIIREKINELNILGE